MPWIIHYSLIIHTDSKYMSDDFVGKVIERGRDAIVQPLKHQSNDTKLILESGEIQYFSINMIGDMRIGQFVRTRELKQ